jgi:hypothetical protein
VKLAAPGAPHLGYCTNIHAGESWAEVAAVLQTQVPRVKASISPHQPMGVGLRLSARASEELGEGEALRALRGDLADRGLYVFTINGFPYGAFHGTRVKEDVYRPDWLEEPRFAYTARLARQLAVLLPEGLEEGTVSTVPVGFAPRIAGLDEERAAGDRMVRVAAELDAIAAATGKTIALAIEPEPFCRLESAAETRRFFERELFSRTAVSRFASLRGATRGQAEAALRRHLAVCFDACHMAVGFEDARATLLGFRAAGISIGKVQVSAGLEVPDELPAAEVRAALAPFVDEVYLHQVTERSGAHLLRWVDLPDALDDLGDGARGTWRIHFHVPLFRERLGPFRSTQPWLRDLLQLLAKEAWTTGLEVETYTWDVLPPELRREEVTTAVARELAWVRATLGEPGAVMPAVGEGDGAGVEAPSESRS